MRELLSGPWGHTTFFDSTILLAFGYSPPEKMVCLPEFRFFKLDSYELVS